MDDNHYLVFSLSGLRYGLDIQVVYETIWLPELTPIAEAPPYIAGVFNLRGKIIPVMNLDARLGQKPPRYQLTDNIIVLKSSFTIGIIVSQIHNVQEISLLDIEKAPSYGQRQTGAFTFVENMAKVDDDIVMILNHRILLDYSKFLELANVEGDTTSNVEQIAKEQNLEVDKPFNSLVFCPEATPKERAEFKRRAQALMTEEEEEDDDEVVPIAIIGLSGEYFGVEVHSIREICEFKEITPIPCCPDHILGNINLRGEILTIVDIRRTLGVKVESVQDVKRAVVVQTEDFSIGIPIDDVYDMLYLNPNDIQPVPIAVESAKKEYLKGTAFYKDNMIAIPHLEKVLTEGNLTVNEEV